MKCPTCSSELSKMWRTGKDAFPGAVPLQWKCGVCGGKFTRADVRPVLNPEPARE